MLARPIALAMATFLLLPTAYSAESAKSILDKVSKNVDAKDEVANVKMTIIEPDGSKKERQLEIRRKGGETDGKVLVKMQSPADLKGTALLSVVKGKNNDQWLYLPSSKQTRRILSSKKSGSFMDSELSYEDMGASSEAKFESSVAGKKEEAGRNFTLIENSAKGESAYKRTVLWIDDKTNLVAKIEYFDKANKPLKVSVFSGYKLFDKVWRAQKIAVTNLQNKRGTTLEISGLKVNKGLNDGEFTESALTEGD